MNRLTKRVGGTIWWYVDGDHYPAEEMDGYDTLVAMQKLAHYEDLEEEGRLIKLPCAEGELVWTIVRQRDSFDDRKYWTATQTRFKLEHFPLLGTRIFLTQEEAEHAIEKLEGGELKR